MRKFWIVLVVLPAFFNTASAQDNKYFSGAYVGGEIGYLNAGNSVNGLYYGGSIGLRKQFDDNIVFGIEANLGSSNADFSGSSNANFRNFENVIDRQTSVLVKYGLVFGSEKRDLISLGIGYINSTVTFGDATGSTGAIAASVGYERALGSKLSLRFKIVSYDVFHAYNGTAALLFRF